MISGRDFIQEKAMSRQFRLFRDLTIHLYIIFALMIKI